MRPAGDKESMTLPDAALSDDRKKPPSCNGLSPERVAIARSCADARRTHRAIRLLRCGCLYLWMSWKPCSFLLPVHLQARRE